MHVEEYGLDTTTTTLTSTSQGQIATFNASTFRSAKFTIQVTNNTDNEYHSEEVLAIHNGSTAAITTFGKIFTGSAGLATFDCDISSGNFRLLATPVSNDNFTFKVVMHMIKT